MLRDNNKATRVRRATKLRQPRPFAELRVTRCPDAHVVGLIVPLYDEGVEIGRDDSNQIVLNDSDVSRRHVLVSARADGAHCLHELGSTNGTLVNGRKILGEVALRDGDTVLVGDSTLLYQRCAPPPLPKKR